MGAGVFSFEEAEKLGLRPVKGQALICPWPKEMPPLQKSIVGKGHIIPLNENQIHLGSTYERGSLDEEFTPGKILPDLAEKARNLVPGLEIQKYLGGGAGVRVAKSGHYYPLLTKIKAKAWLMSGLGSRGLLYHAYAAKELVYTAFNPSIKPL